MARIDRTNAPRRRTLQPQDSGYAPEAKMRRFAPMLALALFSWRGGRGSFGRRVEEASPFTHAKSFTSQGNYKGRSRRARNGPIVDPKPKTSASPRDRPAKSSGGSTKL